VSKLWRALWRTHFFAGLVIAPALLWFAFTGLIILYTDPVDEALNGDVMTVRVGDEEVPLDAQLATIQDENPDWELASVTPGRRPDRANAFTMTDDQGVNRVVYVDQYTGSITGVITSDTGLVAFANRTHGSFLPRQYTMPIPSLTGMIGDGPAFIDVEVGEVIVEIVAGWGLVLAITGIYLWWPRQGTRKRLFIPRFTEGGRPMWRDLHASGGTVLSVGLVFFVVTGLPWATFWGNEFSTLASKITPNTENFWEYSGPASNIPKVGDLTRFGVTVPWATANDSIPTSDDDGHGGHHHSSDEGSETATPRPAPAETVGLEAAYRAAQAEGMKPGFSITPPVDTVVDDGSTAYGAYVVINPWPSSLGEQGALYLDQFTAKTLGTSDSSTWGGIQRITEFGVQTHMGTQFGLINRILLTSICVLVVWNVVTAVVMWSRRRRSGTLGAPRKPVDERTQRSVGVFQLILSLIYPLWGASLLLVLAAQRLRNRLSGRSGGLLAAASVDG
jgi:uncharacterized iron-regulated membrane protein